MEDQCQGTEGKLSLTCQGSKLPSNIYLYLIIPSFLYFLFIFYDSSVSHTFLTTLYKTVDSHYN